MKKMLALLLALITVFTLLSGCTTTGDNDPEGEKDPGGSAERKELVVGTTSDMGSLYPFGAALPIAKTKRVMFYETLFWMDSDGALQPVLGKSYENLGDNRYSIEIFDYISDSEGNHMTAADIIYTLELYIADGSNAATIAAISDYQQTGEYTFEVAFNSATPGLFENLVSTMTCITQAAWENSPNEMSTYPVGTSGYVLNADESTLGSVYVIDKRDDYWQTDEQYLCDRNVQNLDRITIKVITDAATLAVELESGEIDFTTDISAIDRPNFADGVGSALDGYIMVEGPNATFARLTFNCGSDSPMQDINLRKAVCYAIDADACNFSVNGGFGVTCETAIYPGLIDSDENMGNGSYFAYDPDYAKELLEQSSYNGETIRVLVNPTISSVAPLVLSYLEDIGLNVEMLEYDTATYQQMNADETGLLYDIDLTSKSSSDTYVFRVLVDLDSNKYASGVNHLFIDDPELQKLYDTAATAETISKDSAKALLDYLEENCYMYGLYYSPRLFFGSDKITYAPAVVNCDALYNAFVLS